MEGGGEQVRVKLFCPRLVVSPDIVSPDIVSPPVVSSYMAKSVLAGGVASSCTELQDSLQTSPDFVEPARYLGGHEISWTPCKGSTGTLSLHHTCQGP